MLSLLLACAPTTTDPGGTVSLLGTAPSTEVTSTGGIPEAGSLLDGPVVCTSIHDPFSGGGPEVVEIDPDTGATSRLVRLRRSPGQPSSLARLDDAVVVCDDGRLSRIDLGTGEIEHVSRACSGVTDLEGGLVVLSDIGGPVTWYPGWDEASADAGGIVVGAQPYATRIGRSDDGRLLTGWHAADEIEAWDAQSGQPLGAIPLEGYDTWIEGISQAGGRLFVMNDGRDGGDSVPWDPRLAEFDPQGNAVADHFFGAHEHMHGLSCRVVPGRADDTGGHTGIVGETGATGGGWHSGGADLHSAAR